MSRSSTPIEPGVQFPDSKPSAGQVIAPASNLMTQYQSNHPMTNNQYNRVPLTSEFYTQYAEKNEFEPIMKIVWNMIESAKEGWQPLAAPFVKRKFNQMVQVKYYPRRPLPLVPEDVPPPVWTSYEETFQGRVQRYAAQAEIKGDYMALAGSAADEDLSNYLASLVSGSVITGKLAATSEFMSCKQDHWYKNARRDNSSNMLEVTEPFRQGYVSLYKKAKGYWSMIAQAQEWASRDQFEFNLAVLPYGTLNKIAKNNYHTETMRSGAVAIDALTQGGKKIAGMTPGLQVLEDSKWALHGTGKRDDEPFIHYTSRGGWCFNNGNEECPDYDDPNMKYGIGYICKGNKNWCHKTLLDLLRENGRYTTEGELDPHHFTLAEDWHNMCLSCGLEPVNGRLDPNLYRVDGELARNESVKTRYMVARRFGEVDPRYSPLIELRRHARRMESLVKEKLTGQEIQDINRLQSISKMLTDIGSLSESQEAFLAAVCIQNSPDIYTYNDTWVLNTTNLEIFLRSDPYNKAPKQIPTIVDLPAAVPNALNPLGVRKCLQVVINGVPHIILGVRLDEPGAAGTVRGQENDVFGYFSVPVVNGGLFSAAGWGRFAGVDPLIGWEAFFGTGIDADAIGTVTADPTKSSYTSPEIYTSAGTKGTEAQQQWVFRSTATIQKNIENAAAKPEADRTTQDAYYVDDRAVGQGFKLPFVVKPPEMPNTYGGINGLRYLAQMYQNSFYGGWDHNLLKECSDGVMALDKLMYLFIGVYTTSNMYFNAEYVPFHLKTDVPELNRLNTAIAGLWGEYYRPFLARRPMKLKAGMGNWFFPRSFTNWLDNVHTPSNWYGVVAGVLTADFGIALDRVEVINTGNNFNGAADDEKARYSIAAAFGALLDSGVLHGNVKDALLRVEKFSQFKTDFEQSTASLSYASWLKESSPLTNTNPINTYRSFDVFFQNECNKFLTEAARAMLEFLVAANADSRITNQQLDKISRNIYAFGLLISGLVQLWLDDNKMDYNISGKWIATKKNQALDPSAIGVNTSKGSRDLDQLKNYIKVNLDERRNSRKEVGSPAATTLEWINTGLMISSNIWMRMQNEMSQLVGQFETQLRSARPDAGVIQSLAIQLMNVYNTPIRPMMGSDHGKPLAGEAIYLSQFVQDLTARGADNLEFIRGVTGEMSQAMHRNRNSEFGDRSRAQEPSVMTTGRLKTHTRDAEAFARKVSGSRFETDSKRNVPVEFVEREPSSARGARPKTYLSKIQVESSSGLVEGYVEPQYMKLRLSKIEEEMSEDMIGKMAAKLWCFSPNNLNVIENMISKKVAPSRRGHIWARPSERDKTGAVLFTVTGAGVAETAYNAAVETAAYNQQNNHYNVTLACYIGAMVYKPNMVLWMYGQTMAGNVSGMRGEAYTDPNSFDPQRYYRHDKDGFVIFVGDGVGLEDIPPCISITSQYNMDRYATMVANKSVLVSKEQHVPGLIYTITRFKLNELNKGRWNARNSFIEEKSWQATYANVEMFDEDYMNWDSKDGAFTKIHVGTWHLSGLRPDESDFLNGTDLMSGRDTPLYTWKG